MRYPFRLQASCGPRPGADTGEPRIVSIVNFIRPQEPRSAEITEEVPYGTVAGKDVLLEGADPEFLEPEPGVLQASWPLKNVAGTLVIQMYERTIRMELQSPDTVDESGGSNKLRILPGVKTLVLNLAERDSL